MARSQHMNTSGMVALGNGLPGTLAAKLAAYEQGKGRVLDSFIGLFAHLLPLL